MTGALRTEVKPFLAGDALVAPDRNKVIIQNVEHSLEPKVMQVLALLATRPGDVFSREAILEAVWKREYGGDESLTRSVSVIRKLLGASAIETITKKGYRLTLPVCTPSTDSLSTAPELSLPEPPAASGRGRGQSGGVAPLPAPSAAKSFLETVGIPRAWLRPLAILTSVLAIAVGGFWAAGAASDREGPAQASVAARPGLPTMADRGKTSFRTANQAALEAYLEGEFHYAKGDDRSMERAQAAYDAAIAHDPEFSAAYARRAMTMLKLPHETDALMLPYLRKALQFDPDGAEALTASAYFHLHTADYDKARADIDRLMRNDPDSVAGAAAMLTLNLREARLDGARETAERIIAIDPMGLEANIAYVRVMARTGQAAKAIERGAWAVEFRPDSSELRWRLGLAHFEAGDAPAGLEVLVDALERSPDSPTIREEVSNVLALTGFADLSFKFATHELALMKRRFDLAPPMAKIDPPDAPPGIILALRPRLRAAIYILQHDLKSALPWLEDTYRYGARSDYLGHQNDYKPYLSIARRLAGDAAGAEALDREILADIKQQRDSGDQSHIYFAPYQVLAAAARGDREEMYRLLEEAVRMGSVRIAPTDTIFDGYRQEARFAEIERKFAEKRREQRTEILARGLIPRLEEVSRRPLPKRLPH